MISKNLPTKTLKDLTLSVKRGLSSYYIQQKGNEVLFINIRDVRDGRVVTASVEKVHVKESAAVVSSRIEPGDIIISIKGSTFKAALADNSINGYVISANLIAFKLTKDVLPEIVVAYFNSRKGQKELQSISAGAVQKALNMRSLMTIHIPVPELQKQKVLAEYYRLSKQHDALMKKEQALRKQLDDKMLFKILEE